ncbi:MAG: hypothetical protein H6616_18245, partial [Ignavibacteria bacterium]|nr:hypothetical protein [Ignavibacteria bacterium]
RKEFTIGYHVVCFIDILGQQERLAGWNDLPANGEITAEFLRALKKTAGSIVAFENHFRDFFEVYWKGEPSGPVELLDEEARSQYRELKEAQLFAQQFGDTFIFYTPIANSAKEITFSPVVQMLVACCRAMLLSLAGKTPVRGAIAFGPGVEMRENSIYGPVLADAYRLESRRAAFPRVVVAKKLVDLLDDVIQSDKRRSTLSYSAKLCRSLICQDSDGEFVVDYLGKFTSSVFRRHDAIKKEVRLASRFALDEAKRFDALGDKKLADRYWKVVEYVQPRMWHWLK